MNTVPGQSAADISQSNRYVSEGEEEYDSDDAEDAEEEETAAAPGKSCLALAPYY